MHAVTPATPVITQLPVPVGATAVEGPVTVAVKEIVSPKLAMEALATTATVGITAVAIVVLPDV